jgi:hypothetical protein
VVVKQNRESVSQNQEVTSVVEKAVEKWNEEAVKAGTAVNEADDKTDKNNAELSGPPLPDLPIQLGVPVLRACTAQTAETEEKDKVKNLKFLECKTTIVLMLTETEEDEKSRISKFTKFLECKAMLLIIN